MSSYISVEDADDYFEANRLITDAWDNSSATLKAKALNMSTKLIDQLNFDGDKTSELQTNQFPRGGDTVIPTSIQEATAECAYALLDGVDIDFEFDNLWTNQQSIASVRSAHRTDDVPEHKLVGIPSYLAWRLLKPYLRTNEPITIMRT